MNTIPTMLYGQRLSIAITHREQVVGRTIGRAKAFNVATTAIMEVLQALHATAQPKLL